MRAKRALSDYSIFSKTTEQLQDRWAIENDLSIGSGPVESAISHIVQQRPKQSGMRWSDPGAQSILNLRTLHENGDSEQYAETTAVLAS